MKAGCKGGACEAGGEGSALKGECEGEHKRDSLRVGQVDVAVEVA